MCANYRNTRSAADLESELPISPSPKLPSISMKPAVDLFPGSIGYIIRATNMDPELTMGSWGLLPRNTSYSDYNSNLKKYFNARSETVHQTFPFKFAWKDARRCVIPVTSFIEWRGEPGSKEKLEIKDASGGMLMIAGLWDETTAASDRSPGHESFTMLTCDPNPFMKTLHHRMPVILDDWLDWLNPENSEDDIAKMMRPWRGDLAAAPAVSLKK